MRRHWKKYDRKCGAAALMVIIYSIHLFVFHALLANPDDALSTNSFASHQSDPVKSVDLLLLLAKKDIAKQFLETDSVPSCSHAAVSVIDLSFFFPVHNILSPRLYLGDSCYRLYSLISLFRI